MDINDILVLDKWVGNWLPEAEQHYQPLATVLQNNTQPQPAQPVEPPLEELIDFLKTVPTAELSGQQLGVLEEMEVANLLGRRGAYWVKKTVRTATYDPATTNSKIQAAVKAIQQAEAKMREFVLASDNLGFSLTKPSLPYDRFRVSICFRENVGIESIPDLKNRSADWFNIIGGVAEASGEKPEDTQVIGVANGSVWVVLGVTAATAKILAVIAKHAREIASSVLGIMNDIEDYRSKKRMNDLIERGLNQALEEAKDDGFAAIMDDLGPLLPEKFPAEKKAKLEASIRKMLTFVEKGGDVDFSTPPDSDPDDDERDAEAMQLISDVKSLISDAQNAKQGLFLLEEKQADKEEGDSD